MAMRQALESIRFCSSKQYLQRVMRGRVYMLYYRTPRGFVERRARCIISEGSNGSQLLQLLHRNQLHSLRESADPSNSQFLEQEEPIGQLPASQQIVLEEGKVRLGNSTGSKFVLARIQSPHKDIVPVGITTVRVAWFSALCKIIFALLAVKYFGDRAALNLLQSGIDPARHSKQPA